MRLVAGILWTALVATYLGAKFHFFTRFDPLGTRSYVTEHGFYWLGMAVIAFLIWMMAVTNRSGR